MAEANNEANKVCAKSSKFAKLLLFVHFEHFILLSHLISSFLFRLHHHRHNNNNHHHHLNFNFFLYYRTPANSKLTSSSSSSSSKHFTFLSFFLCTFTHFINFVTTDTSIILNLSTHRNYSSSLNHTHSSSRLSDSILSTLIIPLSRHSSTNLYHQKKFFR